MVPWWHGFFESTGVTAGDTGHLSISEGPTENHVLDLLVLQEERFGAILRVRVSLSKQQAILAAQSDDKLSGPVQKATWPEVVQPFFGCKPAT